MTTSPLTTYNSEGHDEVYSYNAETDVIRCASCNPSGGQTAERQPCCHRVRIGPVHVGRRADLLRHQGIARAAGHRRHPRRLRVHRGPRAADLLGHRRSRQHRRPRNVSFFFGNLQTGLESVSRDGTDVYFSTFETLVPEDQNGSFVKIYDARTGGGFDFTPDLGNCAAADECHGAGSAAAATPAGSRPAAASAAAATCRRPAQRPQQEEAQEEEAPARAHRRQTRAVNSHRSGQMVDARREKELKGTRRWALTRSRRAMPLGHRAARLALALGALIAAVCSGRPPRTRRKGSTSRKCTRATPRRAGIPTSRSRWNGTTA